MNTTRRDVLRAAALGVIAGTLAQTGLPAAPSFEPVGVTPASPPSHPQSPFIPFQRNNMAHLLSYSPRDEPAAGNMGVFDFGFTHFPDVPINSVEAAEDQFLSTAFEAVETWDANEWPKVGRPDMTRGLWLSCMIRRHAAYIAHRGRRGCANVALMHPNMINDIGHEHIIPPKTDQVGFGRWRFVGEIPHKIMAYCSNHLPADEIFVAYRQHLCDAGAALLDHGDGKLSFAMHSNPQNYISRIRFV